MILLLFKFSPIISRYNSNGGNYRGNSNGGYNRGGGGSGGGGGYPMQNDAYKKRDQSSNGETLRPVNYDSITVAPFRKNFYSPTDAAATRSPEEIASLYVKHEITTKGRDCPGPMTLFTEGGFPDYILDEINKQGFVKPTAIQSQGMTVALSGRNLVGIAKTGSGKTLAYVIPGLIHLKHQPNVKSGEGPIVLILAPTRELAQQIQHVANDFGLRNKVGNTCIFGGAPKQPQMRDLAKGCEVSN